MPFISTSYLELALAFPLVAEVAFRNASAEVLVMAVPNACQGDTRSAMEAGGLVMMSH